MLHWFQVNCKVIQLCTHRYLFFSQILLPYRLFKHIKYSSLCCRLSVLSVIYFIYSSVRTAIPASQFILPSTPLVNHKPALPSLWVCTYMLTRPQKLWLMTGYPCTENEEIQTSQRHLKSVISVPLYSRKNY